MLPVMQMKHKDQYPIQFSSFYPNMAKSIAAPLNSMSCVLKLNAGTMTFNQFADKHLKLYVDTTVSTTI